MSENMSVFRFPVSLNNSCIYGITLMGDKYTASLFLQSSPGMIDDLYLFEFPGPPSIAFGGWMDVSIHLQIILSRRWRETVKINEFLNPSAKSLFSQSAMA